MSTAIDWPEFIKTLNKRGMKLREGNPDVMAGFPQTSIRPPPRMARSIPRPRN